MGHGVTRAIFWCAFFAVISFSCPNSMRAQHAQEKKCPSYSYMLQPPEGDAFAKLLTDAWYTQINLVSWDTVKILAIFTPWYIITRHVDQPIHELFYCHKSHRNQWQLSCGVQSAVDKSALGISVGLTALSFNPWNEELARAARVYSASLIPIWLTKNIFKLVRYDGCLRPRCEYFDRHKLYYGGCPSGHMAFMVYATTFFGLHYGPWWWIPLGAASVAMFCTSVNSNRHFVSQLIAGTALGVMYGVAANKVIDAYDRYDFECGVTTDAWGKPALELSYSF